MVSGVTTSFGRPERSASSVSVRPLSNSAYHRQMVFFMEQSPRSTFQAIAELALCFFSSKSNGKSTHEIVSHPLF